MKLLKNFIKISAICSLLVAYLITTDCLHDYLLPTFPEIDFNKTWNVLNVTQSVDVKSIIIKVPEDILVGLKTTINRRILPPSIPNSNFKYGFNSDYMKTIIKYWSENYVWRHWEEKINSLPHFFTTINGIQIHLIHVKPKLKQGQKSIPILLLHGWPGSFFEFYKVIPMLVDTPESEEIAFEIICPSLPGYGWTDAPQKPGFGIIAASSLMFNLMDRLNVTEKFYIQGGDFGSVIAATMSKIKPEKIAGIHLNMINMPTDDIRYWLKVSIGSILPRNFHFLSEEDQMIVYPFNKKLKDILNQLGFYWHHVTRPSTLGIALSDNPVGLAAYILEKFGAVSNTLEDHLNSPNGGIEDAKISKDEMLTNIMIYHITNSISSSIRLYLEMWGADDQTILRYPVKVPTGIALFPNELFKIPKEFAKLKYRNIRQFTHMSRGGHFAALEEPELLTQDIKSFVYIVEYNSDK